MKTAFLKVTSKDGTVIQLNVSLRSIQMCRDYIRGRLEFAAQRTISDAEIEAIIDNARIIDVGTE